MRMNNKIIIYSLTTLLAVSFIYLTYAEQRQQNPDYQKDWWVLYFSDIKSPNLNFVIENHGADANFHWEVLQDKNRIKENEIKIMRGETWTSNVQVDNMDGKVIIKVLNGEDKKYIYKNFEK